MIKLTPIEYIIGGAVLGHLIGNSVESSNNVTLDMRIERVIFNKPATVVFWKDGTKTVVRCSKNDKFNKTMGLAMAICKKVYGNKGTYNEVFKRWCNYEHEVD